MNTQEQTEQFCTDCNVVLVNSGDEANRYLDDLRCIDCALRYRYCPNCSEFLLRSDMRNDTCKPCFKINPCLAEYHYKLDSKVKIGEGKRYFGVELETVVRSKSEQDIKKHLVSIDELMGDTVAMKRDGSLGSSGIEIVTRPATREKQYIIWDKFLSVKHPGLVSWESDVCGMHVHVSRDGLTENTIAKTVCFVNATGNKKFMYVLAGRRDNSYSKYAAKTLDNAAKFNGQRHEAVNIGNEETIEFRLFKGTLKKQSVFKNIEFCDAILDYCSQEELTLTQAMSRAALIRFVRHEGKWPHLLSFIMARWYGKSTELSQAAGWVARKNCSAKNELDIIMEDND